MFTGLIETVCTVKSVRQTTEALLLTINLGQLANKTKVGDSIAINGVCLTVAKLADSIATFDVSRETLEKSTLRRLAPHQAVNAELAIKAGQRFGGHFVQGHVDGTATIKAIENKGRFRNIKFSVPSELLDQMVLKGSVAVNGISLTIAELNDTGFSVALIPQTLEKTTLGTEKVGDCVNIETDIIVKTIKTHLENILPQKQNLTMEKLKEMGF